jgi:hypothetical protein
MLIDITDKARKRDRSIAQFAPSDATTLQPISNASLDEIRFAATVNEIVKPSRAIAKRRRRERCRDRLLGGGKEFLHPQINTTLLNAQKVSQMTSSKSAIRQI